MADIPVFDGMNSALRRAIPALGLTQMVAWGTTYYLPAVLRERFEADLGVTGALVFGGVTIMVVTAALLAWPAGRLMDRRGAGRLLPLGSLFLALGLVNLAASTGPLTFMLTWIIFGIGMSLGMANAAFAALTQMAGQGARRAITVLLLFGGLASTVFWPLTLWLDETIGWRAACLVFAGIHALVCAPLHLSFLAGRRVEADPNEAHDEHLNGVIPPGKRLLAGALVAVAMAGNGFVSWGLDLHLIAMFREYGLSAALAVTVAAVKGPAMLAARVSDIVFARSVTPLRSALIGAAMVLASLFLALSWAQGFYAAIAFVLIHAFGSGLLTVARATLPLVLLGAHGYATTMGKIALPTQIVYAFAPLVFSVLMERIGMQGTLLIAVCASCASLAAYVALVRMVRRGGS